MRLPAACPGTPAARTAPHGWSLWLAPFSGDSWARTQCLRSDSRWLRRGVPEIIAGADSHFESETCGLRPSRAGCTPQRPRSGENRMSPEFPITTRPPTAAAAGGHESRSNSLELLWLPAPRPPRDSHFVHFQLFKTANPSNSCFYTFTCDIPPVPTPSGIHVPATGEKQETK